MSEFIARKAGAGPKTSTRSIVLPPALKTALSGEPKAKAAFAKLPSSHKREYVEWIAGAKKAETLDRRVQRTILMLLGKERGKESSTR